MAANEVDKLFISKTINAALEKALAKILKKHEIGNGDITLGHEIEMQTIICKLHAATERWIKSRLVPQVPGTARQPTRHKPFTSIMKSPCCGAPLRPEYKGVSFTAYYCSQCGQKVPSVVL